MRWFEHLAALSLSTAPAPDGGQDALLRWTAPTSCPSRADVEAAIAASLGRPLGAADAGAVTATAILAPTAEGRWSLRLSLEPRDAPPVERVAVAANCSLLAETAALMVAVAIDPELAIRHPPAIAPRSRQPLDIPLEPVAPPPAATPEPPPAAAPTQPSLAKTAPAPASPAAPGAPAPAAATAPVQASPAAPEAPAPAPRSAADRRTSPVRDFAPRPPLRAALAAAAVLDLGALPRPAPGLAVRLALLTRARVELGLLHLFKRPARIDADGRGGDLRLTAAQLVACPRLLRRRLELPLCGGFELGVMRGQGIGLPVRARDRVVWFAFLLDGRVLWAPIPRLALGAQLGLAAPLLAARFRIDGLQDDLHRAAPVTVRGALTLELRLP